MAQQSLSLSLKVDKGIALYGSNDYYAALGLPVTADAYQIRKKYLDIAKNLHPDVYGRDPEEKEKATKYFCKLVSPAYNSLIQDRERLEYTALLRLLAKRLMKRGQKILPESEIARQLLSSPSDRNYQKAISEIAELQYCFLDRVLEYTGQLSELNLVYVLAKEGYQYIIPSTSTVATPTTKAPIATSPDVTTPQSPSAAPRQTSSPSHTQAGNSFNRPTSGQGSTGSNVRSNPNNSSTKTTPSSYQSTTNPAQPKGNFQTYISQAESYIAKQQWSMALKELRSALQIDNQSSKCHALLGLVYMNQKLTGMAKVSFQQALKLNPKEAIALQNIAKVNGSEPNKKETKKGGFFGWLGGQ